MDTPNTAGTPGTAGTPETAETAGTAGNVVTTDVLKVMLFGSGDLYGIPDVIVKHIENIMNVAPNAEFIVADGASIDSGFHKVLSGIGARRKTTIYSLDTVKNNKFDLEVKTFTSKYDEVNKKAIITDGDTVLEEIFDVEKEEDLPNNRSYFEFKDRQLIKDCSFAICYWDGKHKPTLRNIDRLKAQGKYVYLYTAEI